MAAGGIFTTTYKPVGTKISHVGTVLGGVDALNAVTEPLAVAIAIGNPKLLESHARAHHQPKHLFPQPDYE